MAQASAHAKEGRADVLFYVQHLLGIGHLQRALVIARALARGGLRVVLASGGMPVPGMDAGGARFVQLPPLRARDESFSELVDETGRPVDESWKAARAGRLRALYDEVRPAVLMTELFPFGRRQMRFELLPLLEAARASAPRPRIVCSLRDVLVAPDRGDKARWMIEVFARSYDLALVHGDPTFLPLERSFPAACEIADRIRYTGYVVEPQPALPAAGAGPDGREVVVSAGGGAVAGPLIEAALAARSRSPLAAAPWRILLGPGAGTADLEAWRRAAPPGIAVEPFRPDFRALLSKARLSISQAGYNTVLEVLAAGVPAVVVPFAGGRETEQDLRARLLAERGLLVRVEEAALSPAALARGIERALDRAPDAAAPALRTDGAAETARLVAGLVAIVRP
jgi:predicted glycosyltransferase